MVAKPGGHRRPADGIYIQPLWVIMASTLYSRLPNAAIRAKYATNRFFEKLIDRLLIHFFSTVDAGRISYAASKTSEKDDLARWQKLETQTRSRLTIVVVTYKQPLPLNCLLASLECQTLQCFDVIVIHDGPDTETRDVVNRYAAKRPESWAYHESEHRSNDYGHTLRDMGIQLAASEYLLITNGDNYYSPRLVEFVFGAIDSDAFDVVMWDMVHSHANPGGNGNAAYSHFSTYPMYNRADIGAYCVKTAVAKLVGFQDRTHDGDSTYLHDLLHRSVGRIKVGKLGKVLMVHN